MKGQKLMSRICLQSIDSNSLYFKELLDYKNKYRNYIVKNLLLDWVTIPRPHAFYRRDLCH